MSYQFLDAYSSVLTADSSVVSGVVQRPVVNIASILSPINVTQAGTWATSVVGVLQVASILGTYLEDSAHVDGNPGLFALGVRNDSVSSFVSANTDYTPLGLDSAGRILMKPFAAEEARVEGQTSLVSSSVTTVVSASGAGLRNYITDIFVANSGTTTTAITFKDGLGTVLGYTIAPASGGSNMVGMMTPIRTGLNTTFDFQPTSPSSIIFVTARGYKAP